MRKENATSQTSNKKTCFRSIEFGLKCSSGWAYRQCGLQTARRFNSWEFFVLASNQFRWKSMQVAQIEGPLFLGMY